MPIKVITIVVGQKELSGKERSMNGNEAEEGWRGGKNKEGLY